MIGVVLWSDPDERKAVFWCEDHGDLAYYDGLLCGPDEACLLQAGDMVEFDLTFENRIRRAYNARVISQNGCRGLQDTLRSTAKAKPGRRAPSRQSGNVIQFRKPQAKRPAPEQAQNDCRARS